MIVPSIDILGGRAVQLVGGRGEPAVDAGDPLAVAERFAPAGPLAVIDLDAALGAGGSASGEPGRGDNRELVRELVRRHPCRVGGGIRTAEQARAWLELGAERVILGTAARPEVLSELPRARVIAALDSVDGEVVVEGWTSGTGRRVEDRMVELAPFVGGFLLTAVEREGRMKGLDLQRVERLAALAPDRSVTYAGGVTTADEVAALDRLGVDAQVGMALYTGRLPLADAVAAPLVSDRPDGLWPTVVCDGDHRVLGLAYSDRESLARALETRRGVYHSRRRGLWVKGETSGDVQRLLAVEVDCDRDALLFRVEQEGDGFCHLGRRSCFGRGQGLGELERRLRGRAAERPAGSYTTRLLDSPDLLDAKLLEEAREVVAAETRDEVVWEAADVLYFLMVRLAREGIPMAEVERELDRRAGRPRRRSPGGGS